jgi:hypothetical protein
MVLVFVQIQWIETSEKNTTMAKIVIASVAEQMRRSDPTLVCISRMHGLAEVRTEAQHREFIVVSAENAKQSYAKDMARRQGLAR